ncbi:MAG: hypothetical protein JNJ54_07765 [Myxococcaceae bacterium]|nr:hypothetical protein [Myxococcaceae bacterium]
MRRWVLALTVLAGPAVAQERWDHQGALSLLAGFGVEGRASIGVGQSDRGVRLFPELGGTFPLSARWHLKGAGRLSFLGPVVGLSFLAGVRSLYGERFKTFFDLDLNVHALPIVTIGPRVAFGVQYELFSVLGAFAAAGVQFGVGPAGGRIGFEVMIGLQARTYLLE